MEVFFASWFVLLVFLHGALIFCVIYILYYPRVDWL